MSGDLVQHWNSTNIHLDTKVQLMYKSGDMATKISTPFSKNTRKMYTQIHTHTHTYMYHPKYVVDYFWQRGECHQIFMVCRKLNYDHKL